MRPAADVDALELEREAGLAGDDVGREADVAIRLAAEVPGLLVGRRVTALATAFYAAPGYLARQAEASELDRLRWGRLDWLAPDESLDHLASARWLRANVPPERIVGRCSSLLGLCALARAGLGVAPLPCYLADADPGLARVGPPVPELASALWLLTHPDLRRAARVRALLAFLGKRLARLRPLLEGSEPARPGAAAAERA